MPVIDYLDLPTKRIYLNAGVRAFHPVDDIYREIRTLRRTDETLRVFDVPVTAEGNVPKGGGKFTPRLAIFRNGWKIVPEDTSHTLEVAGEMITDDGQSGPSIFDTSVLSAGVNVVIQYEPPAAEVIVIEASGGGGTSASAIYDYFTDDGRQEAFQADVSLDDLRVINDGVKKASRLIPHSEDI
jgi:hypothetical protein